MNIIQRGIFKQDNTRPHTACKNARCFAECRHAILITCLYPVKHVWDTIGRQFEHYLQPTLTVAVFTLQAWNPIPQSDIQQLYGTMHGHLEA